MANELRGADSTGNIEYAVIANRAGQFWNGSAFESYSSVDYANYPVTCAEEGTSGIYFGTFPTGITSAGTYDYFMKRQAGGSPAEDDPVSAAGKVDWTGSSSAAASAGAMSGSDWRNYVLRGGFKRTDKDTELYEETSDAIQEMRRRFGFAEAETEKTTTDTISVLGDFKLDIESDFGLLVGILLEDGQNGIPLIHVSKQEFDNLYPWINVDTNRGYPKHFTVYGGMIQIGPIPDRVSFAYRIAYSSKAGTITQATTGVPFTNDYRDILRDNVLGRLYKLMDSFDKAAIYKQNFELGFEQAKSRERKNSGASLFNVKPFGM